MKRKASLGFILLFLLYLGCKSSLFGLCLSPDAFVETKKLPPCHQTENKNTANNESCDCPIILDSLQSPNDSATILGKPYVSSVLWVHSFPSKDSTLSMEQTQIGFSFRETRLPTHSPIRTIRLLI
ncbi:hypothetical protein EHQ46_09710 [Leptospira yanagawae]|uniref:Lipoprotein n=1 Tax=Leptospira yanagawae TaxID=293069 RepID=A0ABY2M139_9LEPT|nr:hypothetical protein [Leptospira yanagawae]TGL20769.1 hypothetical protein EHQ46_09710 [Leptospira yanagawae]